MFGSGVRKVARIRKILSLDTNKSISRFKVDALAKEARQKRVFWAWIESDIVMGV